MKFLLVWVPFLFFMACEKGGFGPQTQIRGMAVTLDNRMSKEDITKAFLEVKTIHANAVLIKTTEIQDNWRASTIYPDPERTLGLQKLYFSIKEAKKLGLAVAFMPILLLKKTEKVTQWRGMIRPENLPRWNHSYEQMILKYAEIAQEFNVDFFGVGSELVSMEFYTDSWKSLIHEVRKIYSGKLFYSSNWDYLSINPAWKDLDFLGLNAYYELAKKGENPSIETLEARWVKIREKAEHWADNFGKQILITEVGYPSRLDGLTDPWDHTKLGVPDMETQKKGYEAFLKGWVSQKALEGLFFYEWLGEGGVKDPSYTPKNKPALKILEKWMQGSETVILSH